MCVYICVYIYNMYIYNMYVYNMYIYIADSLFYSRN